jgi:thioredoxin reductase (NADPH)
MAPSVHPFIEARRDQMFPMLAPAEIDRLARFGEHQSYAAGESLVATGAVAPGAFIILAGRVDVSERGLGHSEPIVTHGPGLWDRN